MGPGTKLLAEKLHMTEKVEKMMLSGIPEASIFDFLTGCLNSLLAETQNEMIAGLIKSRIEGGGHVDEITRRLVPEIAAVEADGNLFVES